MVLANTFMYPMWLYILVNKLDKIEAFLVIVGGVTAAMVIMLYPIVRDEFDLNVNQLIFIIMVSLSSCIIGLVLPSSDTARKVLASNMIDIRDYNFDVESYNKDRYTIMDYIKDNY
jgi:hypothetical protein